MAKTQKTTVRHFGFTEKVYICTSAHCYSGIAIIEMTSCECRLRCAIAVEARRRRAARASIIIFPTNNQLCLCTYYVRHFYIIAIL